MQQEAEESAAIIELPNEMWYEILKHFELEKRLADITAREQILLRNEQHILRLQKNITNISNEINDISIKVRPLCDKIDTQIEDLTDSINNKLILMEPHISAPLQNLQQYISRLKALLQLWYM